MAIFLMLFLAPSCGCLKNIPPAENNHSVEVRDSVRIIDSIRIREATRFRDFAWFGDTLKIKGQRSKMWAVADTTKEVVIGGLEEDEIKERTHIEYKDREVHDTTYIKEPYPVEVEVKTTPEWAWKLLIFNILLAVGGGGVWAYFKYFKPL